MQSDSERNLQSAWKGGRCCHGLQKVFCFRTHPPSLGFFTHTVGPRTWSPGHGPRARPLPARPRRARPARPGTLALGPSGLAQPAHRHAPTPRTGLAGKSRHHSHALQDQYGFTSGCSRHSLLTLLPRPQNAPARPGPVLLTRKTHGSHGLTHSHRIH